MQKVKNRARISKRSVDAFKCYGQNRSRLWDTDLKGFCLCAYPSGRKVYLVGYRNRRKQYCWYTIGKHGDPWSPDNAREKAKEILGDNARGISPAKKAARAYTNTLTLSKLIDLYLDEGPLDKPDKRASSWKVDKGNLNNHARPLLGKFLIDELKTSDLSKFQNDVMKGISRRKKTGGIALSGNASSTKGGPVRGGRGAAAHAIRSLSALFGWAMYRGLIKTNPCGQVRKIQDGTRERYLTREQAQCFFNTIDKLLERQEITQSQVDCIELIAYTAARRGEIQALRWNEIDFERRFLVLPPIRHKTGGVNQPKVIVLTDECIQILKRRRAQIKGDVNFVFPSSRICKKGYIQNLSHSWAKIVGTAELDDFRIHDLRHAYASFAINAGLPLKVIGANLGHKRSSTTERYAHLIVDARRSVSDEVQEIYNDLRN